MCLKRRSEMRLNLKTAPAIEPLTLDEAKNHLRVDSADDNVLITALIITARQMVEKETKRAFITQTWQMYLDAAPAEIEIPKPPLQSISSIIVVDDDGGESEVSSTIYDVDASQGLPGRVKLKSSYAWPYHRGFVSFIIEFKAGYSDTADGVPQTFKQAILQLIGHLYDNRESSDIPEGVKTLLWPYKILKL